MPITVRKHTHYTAEIPDVGELDTGGHNPSESCYEAEWHINPTNPNEAVLLFCQYDQYCENPLDDCDGMGKIHHHPRSSYGRSKDNEYYASLGVDSDGGKNLDDVLYNHEAVAVANYVEAVLRDEDLADLVAWTEEAMYERTEEDESSDTVFVRNCLKQDAQNNGADCRYYGTMADVLRGMFDDPRYFPGDPDAVLLDVYEHGQRAYSIAGHGMQCRWDTSRGEAVWVPDDCAREEIDRRAKVYAFGSITDTNMLRGKTEYIATFDKEFRDDGESFDEWHKAFAWLETVAKAEGWTTTPEQLATGRARANYEVAKSSVEVFDAWQRGECYFQVCLTYTRGDADSPWELTDTDTCGGFVGSEWAESARYDYAPNWVSREMQRA